MTIDACPKCGRVCKIHEVVNSCSPCYYRSLGYENPVLLTIDFEIRNMIRFPEVD